MPGIASRHIASPLYQTTAPLSARKWVLHAPTAILLARLQRSLRKCAPFGEGGPAFVEASYIRCCTGHTGAGRRRWPHVLLVC